ncbi:hypothetical protein [Microbispora sp. H11081]|uniref:hypothetical protein n=1 Tax=Microbispora sp. H11081 TaxID=2729107 RepID=UPI00147361E7|nr:hypothetical protein [Microbispora sp. H11081]
MNRFIEPSIQTLILTLEVTKGAVTQQCAKDRFPHQKTHHTRNHAERFPGVDHAFAPVGEFLTHH